jgi:hypothetical protein
MHCRGLEKTGFPFDKALATCARTRMKKSKDPHEKRGRKGSCRRCPEIYVSPLYLAAL